MFLSIIVALTLAPGALPQAAPIKPWPPAGVFAQKAAGVVMPRVLKEVKPNYTKDAKDAKIKGIVTMEVIVEKDGKVGEVRVKRSLDTIYGLDDEAVKSVKKWEFAPGTKDGVAVPVLVEIEMTFSLR
jgi:protein TonB